jgi:hypothetical protein
MRTKSLTMVVTLLLMAGAAAAQDGATPAAQPDVAKAEKSSSPEFPIVNVLDIGVRGTSFGSDSYPIRFPRYRDVRDGGTLDRFRLFKDTNAYRYNLQADHVGYRDQRFSGTYTNYGKVKASFEWNQIPLNYSNSTQTLYDTSTTGTLSINDSIQSGIQNKTLALGTALTVAPTFELRTRRDIATGNVVYSATPNVDVGFTLRNTQKQGGYPWGGTFGISNAIASEMPVPVDHRTTDLGTSLEYSNDRGYARLAYDGSFFRNNVTTLVFDNPGRVSDSPTAGPVQGRMALWPNTDMNTVSASGGLSAATPGWRATQSATWNNAALLPFTIGTALVSPALDRPTAEITAWAMTTCSPRVR